MRLLDLRQSNHSSTPTKMSDLLKTTLASYVPVNKSLVELAEVPLGQLEFMAAKVRETALQDRGLAVIIRDSDCGT